MERTFRQASPTEALALLAGDKGLIAQLARGEPVRVPTPLRYPGRRRNIVLHLTPAAHSESVVTAGGEAARRAVRISDGGDLIRVLEEQGLDLETDLILSKTVYHAVQEVPGAGIGGGQMYLDSNTSNLVPDLWRFLQLVAEIIGLRHGKYKEALLQLSKHPEAKLGGPAGRGHPRPTD